MECRSQFTFYKSFDDVIGELTDSQIAQYIKTMLDVQFLRIKTEDVSFSDPLVNIIWKSQKYSIEKSIKGYIDGQKRDGIKEPYLGIYCANFTPYEGGHQQVKGEVQVKGEEEGKEEGGCKTQVVEHNKDLIDSIVLDLNAVTNSRYKLNGKKTRDAIKARLNEGFLFDDFHQVHITKFSNWGSDEKMSKFLRPETLYSNKFEGYLNEKVTDYQKSQVIQSKMNLNPSQMLNLELGLTIDGEVKL